jgi:outer membrane receptor protein involved in Fe transport
LDFQASYDFGNGVSAVFQAKNLTDEVNASYWGSEELTGTIQHFGRQYFLGVNYSF